jgi:hypothetical protein
MVAPEAAHLAREVVGRVAPVSPARAKALLFAASRVASFAVMAGLELRAEVIFCPAVIERFIVVNGRAFSAPTARTLRTNCRALGRALAAYPEPAPVRLPRERAKKPYAVEEISAYLACADAQPTECRRHRSVALICLGAGAGLVGADLSHVRGPDVVARSGGVVVDVGGRHPGLPPPAALTPTTVASKPQHRVRPAIWVPLVIVAAVAVVGVVAITVTLGTPPSTRAAAPPTTAVATKSPPTSSGAAYPPCTWATLNSAAPVHNFPFVQTDCYDGYAILYKAFGSPQLGTFGIDIEVFEVNATDTGWVYRGLVGNICDAARYASVAAVQQWDYDMGQWYPFGVLDCNS